MTKTTIIMLSHETNIDTIEMVSIVKKDLEEGFTSGWRSFGR